MLGLWKSYAVKKIIAACANSYYCCSKTKTTLHSTFHPFFMNSTYCTKLTLIGYRLLMGTVLCLFFLSAQGQTRAVAFVDLDQVYEQLPDAKQLQVRLQTYSQELKQQIDIKKAELRNKQEAKPPAPDKVPKSQLPTQYTSTNTEVEQLNKDISLKENEQYRLLEEMARVGKAGIMQKVAAAVQQVVLEKKYQCVLNKKDAVYFTEIDNITNLVLEKLGVVTNR